jgi:hypothetical protein
MIATPPAAWWDWTFDKIQIANWTGLADDTLHMHAGLLILMLSSIAFRRPPWNWRPWLVALALELLNEIWDLTQPFNATDEGNIPASLHDVGATMLWPTIILLLFPLLHRRGAQSAHQRLGKGSDLRADVLA